MEERPRREDCEYIEEKTASMKLNLKDKTIKRLNLTSHPRYTFSAPTRRRISIRPKSYQVRLMEKQRLRYHHALTDKQLEAYAAAIRRNAGPKGLSLLCELAMRLDSILFQVGFADSILSARQLIRHGHIFVNGYSISVPKYRCQPNDVICVSPILKIRQLVNRNLLKHRLLIKSNHSNPLNDTYQTRLSPSDYVTTCVRNQKIIIQRDIKPRELTFKVNHMLVMEYFA